MEEAYLGYRIEHKYRPENIISDSRYIILNIISYLFLHCSFLLSNGALKKMTEEYEKIIIVLYYIIKYKYELNVELARVMKTRI